jgi:hypothetical protein
MARPGGAVGCHGALGPRIQQAPLGRGVVVVVIVCVVENSADYDYDNDNQTAG